MNTTKTNILTKINILILLRFGLLLSLAVLAPLFGNQIVSGPIVNAVLFISVFIVGIRGAVLIAFTPSLIALSTGLLPLVLALMIPFIIMGNIILVLSFYHLRSKNYWLGVISASLFKFIFLFSASSIISSKLAVMMGWPQLLTALAGGLIAYFVLKSFREI